MRKIVIIGNGVAGTTAARHLRKLGNDQITLISKETPYFYSRPGLMYVYMGHMTFDQLEPYERNIWSENKIKLIHDEVLQIDLEDKIVRLKEHFNLHYDVLVLAMGSNYRLLDFPGSDGKGIQGFYSFQDLQLLEENTKNISSAVIVGGGLIGVEMAEMLLSRKIEVHFLVRQNKFWNSVLPDSNAEFVMQELDKHKGLHMHYDDEIDAVEKDISGRVKKVITKQGKEIHASFLGLCIGVVPNLEIVKDLAIEQDQGILVNEFLRTSEPDVYAIGDCAQLRRTRDDRGALEQVWYSARKMGEVVAKNICGSETEFDPGLWYNSAKFFNLEYQNYGVVPQQTDENSMSFTFTDIRQPLLIHFVFDKRDLSLKGINCFGTRLRQEVVEWWILSKRSVDEVIEDFQSALFDSEFSKNPYEKLLVSYNQYFNKDIKPRKKVWWRSLIDTLQKNG